MSKALDKQPNSEDDGKKPIPRWLPLSLLAVTTVALTVPAVLLWRQKRALGNTHPLRSNAPPSRRRVTGNKFLHDPQAARLGQDVGLNGIKGPVMRAHVEPKYPPPRRSGSLQKSSQGDTKSTVSAANGSKSVVKPSRVFTAAANEGSASLVDGPLMSIGALGIATGAVALAAAIGIWGVRSLLGVDNVDDFAIRVRQLIRDHMPILASKIYRHKAADSVMSIMGTEGGGKQELQKTDREGWTWDAAEDRLTTAYESGGVGEWAECAMRELEAEESLERTRRGI